MNDFVATLGARLQELSIADATRTPARVQLARPAARRRRMPRPTGPTKPLGAALSAGAGAAATAAVFITLASTDRAELPVFGTPASDASALRGAPGFPTRAGLDLRQARAFETPSGTGYVVASSSGPSAVCLVLPDADTGSYGSGCTPLATAERNGSIATLSGTATTIAAFLLPAGGGPPVTITEGRRQREVAVQRGVAVVTVQRNATLEYTTPRGTRTQRVPAPFSGPQRLQCPGTDRLLEITPEITAGVAAGRFSYLGACQRQR